ncbi:hypothetical protein [Reinekea blandensis]|uniref:Uncharacterized protein n=1 Tax=Reinekea blandensis MED297 TaxID=314283 RepID=A4B956_9GAMM|nr:hypothetical protein [Reinekea blandensis]EAR11157.1 hypothetical protein MED297_19757 [Reinekea sp. MED297] [Reinekea blandensis MED297]
MNRLLLLASCLMSLAHAQNTAVIIGGGHEPLANEAALERTFSGYQEAAQQLSIERVTALFADGTESSYAIRNDDTRWVTRQSDPLGLVLYPDDLRPGTFRPTQLGSIQPATKANVLTALNEALQPTADMQSALLIFSGHGQKSARAQNNALRLWHDDRFTTNELHQLTSNSTASVTRFIASHCYSGSFHDAALTMSLQPDAHGAAPMCGFTSVPRWDLTEECTAAVQSQTYQEYGLDLMQQVSRSATTNLSFDLNNDQQLSLYEAHLTVISTMQDRMDLPLSSSEAYLLDSEHWYEQWSLQPRYIASNPYYRLVQRLSTPMEAAIGTADYFRELNQKLTAATEAQAQAARVEYDNMDGAVLLRRKIHNDLLLSWPQLAAPASPAARQLLGTRGDEVRRWLLNHPDLSQLYDYETRSAELSEQWIKATRELAGLRRLHQSWQLANRYEQVMNGRAEQKQQYLSLRRCENWTPTLKAPFGQ